MRGTTKMSVRLFGNRWKLQLLRKQKVFAFAIIAISILKLCCIVDGCRRQNNDDEENPTRGLGGGGIKVEYRSGDCSCEGLELRKPGNGPRTLRLHCNHRNRAVTCEYKGNPHGCSKYNKNGQQEFYQQALNDHGRLICSLPVDNLFSPRGQNITKICGDMGDKNFKYESGS